MQVHDKFIGDCSVRFSLLSEEEQKALWPLDSEFILLTRVQLQARHWIIRDQNGEVTQNIKGDGVIGKHPILTPGTARCEWCMCTGAHVKSLHMTTLRQQDGLDRI